jgi:hypothetical protein
MVAAMSRNRICMHPMSRLNIHPGEFIFSPFGEGAGGERCEDGIF